MNGSQTFIAYISGTAVVLSALFSALVSYIVSRKSLQIDRGKLAMRDLRDVID